MSTQTIATVRQRWRTYLRIEGWREAVGDRLRCLIGNTDRLQTNSASMDPVTVRLVRNELVRVEERSGRRVVIVRKGIVWLTGTPARGDVILQRGGRFEFGDRWPFVLQALEEAEIDLLA